MAREQNEVQAYRYRRGAPEAPARYGGRAWSWLSGARFHREPDGREVGMQAPDLLRRPLKTARLRSSWHSRRVAIASMQREGTRTSSSTKLDSLQSSPTRGDRRIPACADRCSRAVFRGRGFG